MTDKITTVCSNPRCKTPDEDVHTFVLLEPGDDTAIKARRVDLCAPDAAKNLKSIFNWSEPTTLSKASRGIDTRKLRRLFAD